MNEERSASFVELFFDLVFVFGVTQVVASIHGHLDWPTVWRAALVLGLLWWAWTQFTWMAGTVDFDDLVPRVVLLLATAGSFVVAVAVQGAWAGNGPVFAAAYFVVNGLAGVFFLLNAVGTDRIAGSVAYVSRTMAGTVLVLIGGFVPAEVRPVFWIAAIVVNLLSSMSVEKYEYDIQPSHFAERHGLFVIIVLGEALIAIGAGAVDQPVSVAFVVAVAAMLLTALTLWWSYFDWLFPIGAQALAGTSGIDRGRLARDAYTILHYPIVAGLILFAAGTEEVLAHPESAPPGPARWALVGGLALVVASEAAMTRRATGVVAWERLALIAALTLVGIALSGASAANLSAAVWLVFAIALAIESTRYRQDLQRLRASRS